VKTSNYRLPLLATWIFQNLEVEEVEALSRKALRKKLTKQGPSVVPAREPVRRNVFDKWLVDLEFETAKNRQQKLKDLQCTGNVLSFWSSEI